jgi:hypothetical protein
MSVLIAQSTNSPCLTEPNAIHKPKMKIAYLTAGAAGMFCGSCLHDNALAKALNRLGHDCILIPAYTPIRTDDENVSIDRVVMGGISKSFPGWPIHPAGWTASSIDPGSLHL